MLRFISNALWFLFGGIWLALFWGISGVILCTTIIGIPFGVQCFKIAKLSLFPYGKNFQLNFKEHPVANIIWVIIGGWELATVHLFFGIFNCMTIIGIPAGIQCFKTMKLAMFPFGVTEK